MVRRRVPRLAAPWIVPSLIHPRCNADPTSVGLVAIVRAAHRHACSCSLRAGREQVCLSATVLVAVRVARARQPEHRLPVQRRVLFELSHKPAPALGRRAGAVIGTSAVASAHLAEGLRRCTYDRAVRRLMPARAAACSWVRHLAIRAACIVAERDPTRCPQGRLVKRTPIHYTDIPRQFSVLLKRQGCRSREQVSGACAYEVKHVVGKSRGVIVVPAA
jgi:hypothetical protein